MDESKHLTVMCSQCFRCIYDFHSFQTSVSVAQLKLVDDCATVMAIKIESDDENSQQTPPDRTVSSESEQPNVENLSAEVVVKEEPTTQLVSTNTEASNDSTETAVFVRSQHHGNIMDKESQLIDATSSSEDKTQDRCDDATASSPTIANEAMASDSDDEKPTTDLDRIVTEELSPPRTQNNNSEQQQQQHNVSLLFNMGAFCETVTNASFASTPNKMNTSLLEYDQNEGKFKCAICGHCFGFQHHLLAHIRSRHKISKDSDITRLDCSVLAEKFSNNDDSKKLFKCDLCFCSYTEKRNLQRHQRLQHPEKLKPKEIDFVFDAITKKYVCKICSRSYTTKNVLRKHITSKHQKLAVAAPENPDFEFDNSSKMFKCKLCNRSYLYKGSMLAHMERRHGQIRQGPQMDFPCPQCSKGFNTQQGLNGHLVNVHHSLYTCNDCGESFEKYRKLAYHKKTHKLQQNKDQSSQK